MFPDVLPTFRERRANQKARLRLLNLKLEGSTVAIVVNGFSSGHHIIERLAHYEKQASSPGGAELQGVEERQGVEVIHCGGGAFQTELCDVLGL